MPLPEQHLLAHRRFGHTEVWWAFTTCFGYSAGIFASVTAYLTIHSVLITVATAVMTFAGHTFFLWDQGVKERFDRNLSADGIESPVWRLNRSELLKTFQSHGEHRGLEVLSKSVEDQSLLINAEEIVVRNHKETLATIDLIRIHDRASWIKGGSETQLDDGKPVTLANVFEDKLVRSKIRSAQAGESDLVSLGLVSSDLEDLDREAAHQLSHRRSVRLGEAMLRFADLNVTKSNFRALALGWSLDSYASDEFQLQNQRPAIVLGVVRRQIEQITLVEAVEAIFRKIPIGKILLANYIFSDDIQNRFSNSLVDFKGYK